MHYATILYWMSGLLFLAFMAMGLAGSGPSDSAPGTREYEIGMRTIAVGVMMLPLSAMLLGVAVALSADMLLGLTVAGWAAALCAVYPPIIRALRRPLPAASGSRRRRDMLVTSDGRIVDMSGVPMEPTGTLH